jgi:hypothetical protein
VSNGKTVKNEFTFCTVKGIGGKFEASKTSEEFEVEGIADYGNDS